MEANGMIFSGLSPDGRLVEISEIVDHPYMVGSQFHPEFKSRPNRPHPLFLGLVKAAQHFGEKREAETSNQTKEVSSSILTTTS
jgi:CTP synthase